MNELSLINEDGELYADSRDVAEAIERPHKELLRTIRTYYGYLSEEENRGERKIAPSDFFVEATYKSEQNKEMPCYLITKKGCDMIANKLTGKKGVLFTAAYVTAFEKMKEQLENKNTGTAPDVGEIIAKTAAAVATDLIKQLVPVITQLVTEAVSRAFVKEETFGGGVPPIIPDKPVAKKCKGREINTGTIWETLDNETQKKAYEMMKSGNYSSMKISHFIFDETGTYISQATLCRYKRNWFNVKD